jgi:hypothetical protein
VRVGLVVIERKHYVSVRRTERGAWLLVSAKLILATGKRPAVEVACALTCRRQCAARRGYSVGAAGVGRSDQ